MEPSAVLGPVIVLGFVLASGQDPPMSHELPLPPEFEPSDWSVPLPGTRVVSSNEPSRAVRYLATNRSATSRASGAGVNRDLPWSRRANAIRTTPGGGANVSSSGRAGAMAVAVAVSTATATAATGSGFGSAGGVVAVPASA